MDHRSRGTAPGPNETIERHEVVERRDHDTAPAARGAGSNLLWLLPLLLVVAGLVWFIFTRGEPIDTRDTFNVEINAPDAQLPRVSEERRVRVEVPTVGGGESGGTAAPAPSTPNQP